MGSERSAEDVFGLLSDEIRLGVLRTIAIAQAEATDGRAAALSFSEIYDRVDVDNTSKLSYHLGELRGTFLRKREDGYAFTYAGEQLIRFVLAENYQQPAEFEPFETDGTCLFCGEGTLVASLEEQYFLIRCSACDRPAFSYRVRLAQVRSHAGEDLIDAVIWEQAGDFVKTSQGICPDCAGRVETTVVNADDVPASNEVPVSFATNSECPQCRRCLGLPLPYAAAYHPESIAFHWDHGVDVLGTGAWEFHGHLHDGRWSTERVATGPDEYRVDLQCESSTLRLFLDESATVTRTERVRQRVQSDRGT